MPRRRPRQRGLRAGRDRPTCPPATARGGHIHDFQQADHLIEWLDHIRLIPGRPKKVLFQFSKTRIKIKLTAIVRAAGE